MECHLRLDTDADDAAINNWSMFPNGEDSMSFPHSVH